MNPLVSVYIINHNYGKFLIQAYYSVLYQSYENIELIVIDNDSTDESKEILKKIELNRKIKIIYRNKSDLVSACNLAIENANGEYILRLDADDYLRKDCIKELVHQIREKNADLVYPDYYEVSIKGKILQTVKHIPYTDEVTLPAFPAHGACTMFRMSSIKEVGGYDEDFDRQDGYYMWIKFILKEFKIINVNESLFFYRIHDTSLSHNRSILYKIRSEISYKVLSQSNIPIPTIDCIIPLMHEKIDTQRLNEIIERLISSGVFRKIIIWSSCKPNSHFLDNSQVMHLDRHYEAELEDQILGPAIYHSMHDYYNDNNPDYLFIRDLNTPYVKEHYFKQMKFMVSIFKHLDCVIGTVETKDKYFRFSGKSLKSIRDHDFVENERERLYKKVRGITLIRYSELEKSRSLVSGIIAPLAISMEDSIDTSDFYYNFLDNDKNSL